MAKREIEKLSESIIENARIPEGKKERVLNDGGGLILRLTPSSTKIQNQYWFYRFTRNGVKRKIGLGVYPDVSLALARKRCEVLRRDLVEGLELISLFGRKNHENRELWEW